MRFEPLTSQTRGMGATAGILQPAQPVQMCCTNLKALFESAVLAALPGGQVDDAPLVLAARKYLEVFRLKRGGKKYSVCLWRRIILS